MNIYLNKELHKITLMSDGDMSVFAKLCEEMRMLQPLVNTECSWLQGNNHQECFDKI